MTLYLLHLPTDTEKYSYHVALSAYEMYRNVLVKVEGKFLETTEEKFSYLRIEGTMDLAGSSVIRMLCFQGRRCGFKL